MTPNECQITRASSGTCSLFLESSIKAPSRRAGSIKSATHWRTFRFSSLGPCSIPMASVSDEPFRVVLWLLVVGSVELPDLLLTALWP